MRALFVEHGCGFEIPVMLTLGQPRIRTRRTLFARARDKRETQREGNRQAVAKPSLRSTRCSSFEQSRLVLRRVLDETKRVALLLCSSRSCELLETCRRIARWPPIERRTRPLEWKSSSRIRDYRRSATRILKLQPFRTVRRSDTWTVNAVLAVSSRSCLSRPGSMACRAVFVVSSARRFSVSRRECVRLRPTLRVGDRRVVGSENVAALLTLPLRLPKIWVTRTRAYDCR